MRTSTPEPFRGAATSVATPDLDAKAALHRRIDELLRARTAANRAFFEAEAGRLATLCHRMAERFARGGRLIACGLSPAARSDARHVAVEFVHPVIVGKRALPALAVTRDGGPLHRQLAGVLEPDDIFMAFGANDEDAAAELDGAIASARGRGCATVAFAASAAESVFEPPRGDPFIAQELVETLYHVLWELVHVFFEHPGLLEARRDRPKHDAGASAFLYPFLAQQEKDLTGVLDDVRTSVLMKADEVAALRVETVERDPDALPRAAELLRHALDAGGTLLCLGNGGSATDAMDAVADYRAAPQGWPSRRALDLTEDTAILTAIANDIGVDALFARQVIAYGRAGDALLAFTTSGNSRNVVQALAEAHRRGITTVALVGYDGGRIADEALADVVITSPSQHIPRIQEAQATMHHVLRELVAAGG